MTDASVLLLTRIAGRETFPEGPAITAGGAVLTTTIAASAYIQNAAGQGDLTWQGSEFGLTAPDSGAGETANVWLISVTVSHWVSDVADFSQVTGQIYDGATPAGSPAPLTLSATPVTDTFTIRSPYLPADVPDLAVQVSSHAVQPGIMYVNYAYAEVSYSYPSAIGSLTIDPAAAFQVPGVSVPLPPVRLVSLGPASASLSPSFGQPTTAGDLLTAWAFSNTSSATFDITCGDPSWSLIAYTGSAYEWFSLWYKPSCGAAETPPVFTSGGATIPLSQLAEYSGARTLDRSGAVEVAGMSATVTATAPDRYSGDLVVAAFTWGLGGGGPTTVGVSATDSGGKPLPLSVADNVSSAGDQFWASAWGQAGGAAGPGADTVTAVTGGYAGITGIVASFQPFGVFVPPPLPQLVPGIQNRAVTIPVRAGRY